jgi:glycosyltransferase involved in cell wall biosynthesis
MLEGSAVGISPELEVNTVSRSDAGQLAEAVIELIDDVDDLTIRVERARAVAAAEFRWLERGTALLQALGLET